MPYVVTLVDWAPIFEWYTARLLVKLGHQMIHVTMRLDFVLKIQAPF